MRYKNTFFLIMLATMLQNMPKANAQGMAISTSGAPAHASAMLDVTSTTQGVLVPRMLSSERTAIGSPANGLLVYQTDGTAGFYYYNVSVWTYLGAAANATNQGNTFNSAGQLVKLNGTGQLPALSGANLTDLPAANLTGTLPAISGANLTGLNAGNISSGTLNDGRLSANVTTQGNTFNAANKLVQLNGTGQLPALSGANLTNLNGANITDHSITIAELPAGASGTKYLKGDGTWDTPAGGSTGGAPLFSSRADISSANSPYTMPPTVDVVFITQSTPITITLPAANSLPAFKFVFFIGVSGTFNNGNLTTINAAGGDTIAGGAGTINSINAFKRLFTDGNHTWYSF